MPSPAAPSGAHLGPSEARPVIKPEAPMETHEPSEPESPLVGAATMMSLSDLKPRDRMPKHQPGEETKKSSVEELRKSINAALNPPVPTEPEAEEKDDGGDAEE